MSKIPTAEEFLSKNIDYVLEKDCKEDVTNAMIEFTKLHAESQRKEILNKSFEVRTAATGEMIKIVTEDSILKAYPLTNIK